VPPRRFRASGFGSPLPGNATALTAALNSALIAPGVVRFLLPLAGSLTARVLSLSLALSFVSPILARRVPHDAAEPFFFLALARLPL